MTEAEARGDDADLAAALANARGQQAAIRDVLEAISASGFDLKEVLRTIAENAVRLCGADNASVIRRREGSAYEIVASAGHFALGGREEYERYFAGRTWGPGKDSVAGRVIIARESVQVDDITTDPDFDPANVRVPIPQTVLGVPIMRNGEVDGVIVVRRLRVARFNVSEIDVLEMFSRQAAIAMENVRLVNETKEALGQQTALSDVLRTISRSAFDLDAVLQAIVERAAGLVGAESSMISRRDGDEAVVLAGLGPALPIAGAPGTRIPVSEATLIGRALLTGKRQYTVDATLNPDLPQDGPRTRLVIPFMRDGKAVGTLGVSHNLPRPFSDRELHMLETFADQAAIAIENVRLFNETKESLAQQTALSEVLNTISRSAFDLDAVLQTIVERAAALCQADGAAIFRRVSDQAVAAATFGGVLTAPGGAVPIDDRTVVGRAMLTAERQYVPDARQHPDLPHDGPNTRLMIPFVRDGVAVGCLGVVRSVARPFSDTELRLFEVFADQAAIAIENVRLFNETTEALKQRTATSEILRVISETLGDPQPVMQAIVDTVLGVCSADSAGFFRRSGDDLILRAVSGAWRGPRPSDVGPQLPFHGDSIVVSALEEGRYQHVADTSADPRYDAAAQWSRTRLAVPVLRGSETIGVIRVGRAEPGGFTEREIRLVEGFADQAAIAFENARLFNETKEALEQQTAVGDVLKTISRSVFDLQPVLDTVVEHAARLAGGDVAWLARITGEDSYRILSRYGAAFEAAVVKEEWGDLGTMRLATSTSVMGRLLRERVVLHIQDITAEKELWDASRLIRATKSRTILAVPMLREGQPIGGVIVGRTTQRPFSDREIQLVQTFADQAAIAIENVRLFDETRESLERQTAVAQVLGAISQSGFELKSVLETVIEHATKLCAAQQGFIYRREGDVYRLAVAHGITPEFKAFTEANPVNPLGRGTITGRVAQDRMTVHVPDVLNDPEYTYWEAQRLGNFRALLGVPMIRNDQVIGVMLLWRTEPRPFTDDQIALVTTFANQATIAIENVRLFDETKEALERQTAISEVLKVISRTTFDILPVMRTVLAHAARLCDADLAWMRRVDSNGALYESANYGRTSELTERLSQSASETREAYGSGHASYAKSIMARVINERTRIHLADIALDPDLYENSVTARINGARTVLAVPLLHDGDPVGMLVVARLTVRPFDEREQQLVDTFAQQAAIAMQNARLFTEIQDKSRQLEVASRHKSEFLANMSHELRTPLNAIIGFSEVLVQGLFGDVNDKQREYLQDVIGSGQHLLSLINDILDLSKIEAGRMELELSTFNFRDALQSGMTIVRERASRHNITLSVVVADELGPVEADERKVKQIFFNLLSNAVKFTPDGGRVDVTVRRDNGDVRVEVRDDGIGIADADQARIFEEFQQVGRERSREGTGLGLTLTKRFVELHGGRIWLESAPGQGSTFTFTLPLRRAAPVRA